MFHIKIELQYCAERCCMDESKTIIYNVYTQIDLSVAILLGDLFHNHYIHLSCNWTKYSIQCPNMMENLLIFSSARNHRTTKWETKKARKINQIQVNQLQILWPYYRHIPRHLRVHQMVYLFSITTIEYSVEFLQGVMAAIFQLTIRVVLRAEQDSWQFYFYNLFHFWPSMAPILIANTKIFKPCKTLSLPFYMWP